MIQDDWQRVDGLLQSALDREPSRRASFLDEACAGDHALRQHVEALLEADREASDFLERPAIEAGTAPATEPASQSLVGRRIGAYRVVRELGRGGMGAVYLAERADEQFRKQVAIKLVKQGVDSDAILHRFRGERQILASLDHPNIATLLDAGTTDDGLSYFVMEYVEGQPIDVYCTTHRLSTRERLHLFGLVCAAVQHAHEHRVVHRDLKPRNILVTEEGVPKLLDFGIAKLLAAEDAGIMANATTVGLRPMTPAYASPEQVRGEPVTPLSDVFALGLLLYELLTERRPYQVAGDTPADIARAICEEEAEKPSTTVRSLAGDLDKIVLMALRKEPSRRYPSVAQFANDLRSYLEGRPVLARRDSLSYRAAKFVTRNKAAVVSAVAAVMVTVAALGVAPLMSRDQGVSQASLPRIRSLAVLPLDNLSGDPGQEYFSIGMTEALISDLARIRDLRVISRTSVMRYKDTQKPLSEIARELNVDALIEGTVLQSGQRIRITAQLVEAGTARHLWNDSYERDIRDVLALQTDVARAITRGIEVTVTPQEGTRLATTRRVDPEAHQLYLWGRHHLGKRTKDGTTNAMKYFERAIEKDATYAPPYASLALTYWVSGPGYDMPPFRDTHAKARAAALKALQLDDTLPEAHIALGHVLRADWNWPGAGQAYQRAIELNPSHAGARQAYSEYLTVLGRLDEALTEAKRGVELDPLALLPHNHLAWAYYRSRKFDEALEQIRIVLELDPNYNWRPAALRGHIFVARGMYREAIGEYEKFAASPDAPHDTRALAWLGHARALSGDRQGALKLLEHIQAMAKTRYVPAFHIALVYVGLGDKDQAFAWLEKAYEARESAVVGTGNPRLDSIRSDPRYTSLLRRTGLP
jgi:eukaryotic-like serine/threonine-protein kinase